RNIGPNSISVDVHDTFTGGNEVAHVMTLTTTFPAGHRASVKGVFTYALNDQGKIQRLRGYWDMSDIKLGS
ncbi:MAG: hypothetical protein KC561_16815, partial [Myxococcales bacterium]|nr:hypothetical protein [Myxococcales bacterium]